MDQTAQTGSTSAEVLRIRNPNALLLPSVRSIVYTALSTNSLAHDPVHALVDIAEHLHRDEMALLLVKESGAFVAVALATWPTWALAPKACSVLHFYSRGSREAREALIKAIVDFAREGGVDKLLGVDMNTKPRAFARLFRNAGKASVVGQLFQFDIGDQG